MRSMGRWFGGLGRRPVLPPPNDSEKTRVDAPRSRPYKPPFMTGAPFRGARDRVAAEPPRPGDHS